MSRITLPQGQSIRQVAERLGVAVDDLLRHAGVADAEAPLAVAKAIEVPDGFLRARSQREAPRDPVRAPSAKKAGMNMWLALDIEQKRTRSAGGMKAHEAAEHELEGLAEARRAYLRFEDDSNELAIALYGQLTSTHSTDVRARAFAGQAQGLAQRHHLFGAPASRSRAQALSAAKAALLADPKLADAHLAMALALTIEPSAADKAEGRASLITAVRLDPNAVLAIAELAASSLADGDMEAAREGSDRALALDADCARALEVSAEIALAERNPTKARDLFTAACAAVPTFVHMRVGLARALRALGQTALAETERANAFAQVKNETERALHEKYWSREHNWMVGS